MEELTTLTHLTICKDDFEALLKLRHSAGIIEHIILLTVARSEEAKKMLDEHETF